MKAFRKSQPDLGIIGLYYYPNKLPLFITYFLSKQATRSRKRHVYLNHWLWPEVSDLLQLIHDGIYWVMVPWVHWPNKDIEKCKNTENTMYNVCCETNNNYLWLHTNNLQNYLWLLAKLSVSFIPRKVNLEITSKRPAFACHYSKSAWFIYGISTPIDTTCIATLSH